jgi:uncharacterized membrane protein YdjX (TVP38/TMEM64 family)
MKLKYPKFLLLLLTFAVAYLLLNFRQSLPFQDVLLSLGFLGVFILGIFYSYGFTAAPATALLLVIAKDQNILLAGLIGGLGSLFADLTLFTLIRTSFRDEIKKLSQERCVKKLGRMVPRTLRKYLVPVLAALIIASPLPDEIGVCMLATTKISPRVFSLLSYCLNTLGILVVLWIGNII